VHAYDILTTPEWFFRVNRALKIIERYIPFELVTVSTVPTIRINDLFTVYDKGELSTIKTISAFDSLITDGVLYTKSYNSLFYSVLQRKIPVRYLALSVSDNVGISDYAIAKKVIVILANDYLTVSDLASVKRALIVLVPDYSLSADIVALSNRTVDVYDIIPVIDYSNAIRAKVLEAKDYISARDYVDTRKAVVITALDEVLTDSISTSKSYSPLLFTMLSKRIPIRYLKLNILDTVTVKDNAFTVKVKQVYANDYSTVVESGTALGAMSIPVHDYDMLFDSYGTKNLTIHAFDIISVVDYSTTVKAKIIEARDYVPPVDYVDSKKVITISALDSILTDLTFTSKSYSPLFFSLLKRRLPIRYLTLRILDTVVASDKSSVALIKVVSASDYIGLDLVTYNKSYNSLFYSLFRKRIPIRYLTLSVSDYIAIADSASVVKIKVVPVLDIVTMSDYASVKSIGISASDYILYDYVPSMSPRDIRYISLYANNMVRTISVLDIVNIYESVVSTKKYVHAYDHIPVVENVAVVNRSVSASDTVTIYENVNIVKLQ